LSNRCQRLGIERRNLDEQWFSIIRPVAPARISPTDLVPTWPINLWSDSDNVPLWTVYPVRRRLGLSQPEHRLVFFFFFFICLFVCLFFFLVNCEMNFNNNNFFNPNMNPYFSLTSFDSDNSNLAMYNMDQSYRPDWDYPTQYDPYPQFYDQDFQNNFHSSENQWGFTYPESNF